jgi:type I site-specific restriction endonuclease
MMVGRGYRQKINFFMNSDKNKFYIKIVDFVEIYNFVVQIWSFQIILRFK